jgi:hypothetical protein
LSDKVIPFPGKLRDSFGEDQWKMLQAEFYLDCHLAARGIAASDPADLEAWLLEARIPAEMSNPLSLAAGWSGV